MRIISWNVNGLRASVRKGGFDWLINESPDIFCLQETKLHPDQLDEGVRNPPGYNTFFDYSRTRKGYSGVAVYSKIRPSHVEYGLGKAELDQEGRFLALFFEDVDIKRDKLPFPRKTIFLNVYFPNGGGGPERLDFKLRYYDAFLEYINKHNKAGYEILFCGDVNTAHEEIDLARPKENADNTGFLPIERAWIDQVVDVGYIDVFRYFYPNQAGKYTYWDMKTFARERNVGWRIDYFFSTPALLKKVTKCKILDEIMGSDHCPLDIHLG